MEVKAMYQPYPHRVHVSAIPGSSIGARLKSFISGDE